MGTIASIEKAKLVVKSTDNKDVTFEIVPTTVFKKGKAKGAQADLKAGMRVVVVTAGETESKAKEIQYAAAATTQQ
jgi:voltage-gated potassium channel Kch